MDIEEDIKILENLKKYLNLLIYEGTHKIIYNNLGWDEKTIDCINAIDHILAEREEDKKKIKELKQYKQMYLDEIDKITDTVLLYNKVLKEIKYLKENNNKLKKYCKEIIKDKQELTSDLLDSIPKQKVKEILIEIQEEYNKLDKEIDKQIKDKNKDYYKCKENIAIMQTLAYCRDKFEELLEDK